MKLITIFIALLLSGLTHAGHHGESSVESFVKDYFEKFNSTSLEASPEQSFTFPAVFINDGIVRVIPDSSVKVVDYEVIKASGWAYSKILKTTVLYEGPNSAVVQVHFNRHKADDSVLSSSQAFYTLVMQESHWKLVGASIPGGITLVE
ncbi:MAG: hypothetical protein HN493_13635 [Gammaproteobacteria bacterium]|jgi:hypothetical protein|nr:hypothetical protein [Gammaproteobacteria bacterium]MBT3735695.1 hypothetical protein [Gammaproteobacteria bacterium]MBT7541441.1 hypothetical protein [Gammaproteobacteria bacterium]|tara:strand:+ start:229 stop:675 length:447 start_codon:yes stop_codon:yes gene_type:complete